MSTEFIYFKGKPSDKLSKKTFQEIKVNTKEIDNNLSEGVYGAAVLSVFILFGVISFILYKGISSIK